MNVRCKRIGNLTVFAASGDELADVADGYASGQKRRPNDYSAELFRQAAAHLRGGVRVIDLGAVRFYADRADGTPFQGPFAPDPDPAWEAQRLAYGARAGA